MAKSVLSRALCGALVLWLAGCTCGRGGDADKKVLRSPKKAEKRVRRKGRPSPVAHICRQMLRITEELFRRAKGGAHGGAAARQIPKLVVTMSEFRRPKAFARLKQDLIRRARTLRISSHPKHFNAFVQTCRACHASQARKSHRELLVKQLAHLKVETGRYGKVRKQPRPKSNFRPPRPPPPSRGQEHVDRPPKL